ncbi:MAG TPA: hypothetical protein VF058_04035 [Actinomycetota bacterium]
MPETYGKRQRKAVKARKASAREERRLARARRREERAAQGESAGDEAWLGEPNPSGLDEPAGDDTEE